MQDTTVAMLDKTLSQFLIIESEDLGLFSLQSIKAFNIPPHFSVGTYIRIVSN